LAQMEAGIKKFEAFLSEYKIQLNNPDARLKLTSSK
jgi:hypothetical protein